MFSPSFHSGVPEDGFGPERFTYVLRRPLRKCSYTECDLVASPTYDDGLCGYHRDANDALLFAREHEDEAVRLANRIERMFPDMTAGQVCHMAANILRSTLPA